MSMHGGLSESAFTLFIGSGEPPTGCPAYRLPCLPAALPTGCPAYRLPLKRKASRSQRLPSAPLLSPVGDGRDRQEVAELNQVPAPERAGQEKNVLLKGGSKTE